MKIKKQKQKRNKKVKNDYNEGKIIIKTRFSSKCYMFSFRGGVWGGECPMVHPLDLFLSCKLIRRKLQHRYLAEYEIYL